MFNIPAISAKSYAIRSVHEIALADETVANFLTTKEGIKIQLIAAREQRIFTLSQEKKTLTFNPPNGVSAHGLLINLLYGIQPKDGAVPEGKRQVAVDPDAAIHRVYRASMGLLFNIPRMPNDPG